MISLQQQQPPQTGMGKIIPMINRNGRTRMVNAKAYGSLAICNPP